MTVTLLRETLAAHPHAALHLFLPDGTAVPAEFHVTEVGHVTKRFIDCGGTSRTTEACVLQVWVSGLDPDHRLTAGRLAKIFQLSEALLPHGELSVEVEYQAGTIALYSLAITAATPTAITLSLGGKTTACLASDRCGIPAAPAPSACGCGPRGCC